MPKALQDQLVRMIEQRYSLEKIAEKCGLTTAKVISVLEKINDRQTAAMIQQFLQSSDLWD